MDLLCQYSGSDSDADKDDEDEPPPAKAQKMEEKRPSNLLPVPEQIQTMFCSKPDGSPAPASAKKRSFHQPLFRRQKKGADYQVWSLTQLFFLLYFTIKNQCKKVF